MGSSRVEITKDSVGELQDTQQSSPNLKKRGKRWIKVIRNIAIINLCGIKTHNITFYSRGVAKF